MSKSTYRPNNWDDMLGIHHQVGSFTKKIFDDEPEPEWRKTTSTNKELNASNSIWSAYDEMVNNWDQVKEDEDDELRKKNLEQTGKAELAKELKKKGDDDC